VTYHKSLAAEMKSHIRANKAEVRPIRACPWHAGLSFRSLAAQRETTASRMTKRRRRQPRRPHQAACSLPSASTPTRPSCSPSSSASSSSSS
jgi:hypothetical protein